MNAFRISSVCCDEWGEILTNQICGKFRFTDLQVLFIYSISISSVLGHGALDQFRRGSDWKS